MESERRTSALTVICSLLFGAACAQGPLYFSNQNTYFLQGLTRTGFGQLSRDWLANQTDHIPLFSLLVSGVQSIGAPVLFHVIFALLAAAYAWCLVDIARRAWPTQPGPVHAVSLFTALTLVHNPWLVGATFGLGDAWTELSAAMILTTQGVAGQTILGYLLLPSTWGVLLVASIAAYLRGRTVLAILLAWTASAFHPTYLYHAALLSGIYLVLLLRRGERGPALRAAIVGAVAATPQILYLAVKLAPTGGEVTALAQSILAEERIPQHALPGTWFTALTVAQLCVLGGGLWVVRRSRPLGTILMGSAGVGLVLSLLQLATGSNGLALVFPWRISVWLVPLGTTLLLSIGLVRIAGRLGAWAPARGSGLRMAVLGAALLILLGSAGAGMRRTVELEARERAHAPLAKHVRETLMETDLHLVPPDFMWYRLMTGAPIFADAKSHPFRDVEVLEWWSRLEAAERFYAAQDLLTAQRALTAILDVAPITHVVMPRNPSAGAAALSGRPLIYVGDSFVIVAMGDGARSGDDATPERHGQASDQ